MPVNNDLRTQVKNYQSSTKEVGEWMRTEGRRLGCSPELLRGSETHAVRLGDLLKLGQQIVGSRKSAVPPDILAAVRNTVDLRLQVHRYYKQSPDGDHDKDQGHLHAIEIWEQLRDILDPPPEYKLLSRGTTSRTTTTTTHHHLVRQRWP